MVTCCTEYDPSCSSVLFHTWNFDGSVYHLIEAASIVSPCFVIADMQMNEQQKRALVALDIEDWAREFVNID